MSRWYPGKGGNSKGNIPIECSKWITENGGEEIYGTIFARRSIEKFKDGLRSKKPQHLSTLASLCSDSNLFSSYCGGEIYTITTARRCWVGHISELSPEQQKELTEQHNRTATVVAVVVDPENLKEGAK